MFYLFYFYLFYLFYFYLFYLFYFYCSECGEIDAQRFSSVFMRVFVQMGLDRFLTAGS
jgi:hypothetical protein